MRSDVALSRRALLAELSAELAAAGVPQPRREALRVWSQLLAALPAEVLVDGETQVEHDTVHALRGAVRRRAGGEPLAHVTGRIGFRDLVLTSDHRALIPRPETEGLVDLLLARVRTGRAADVGTGGGCLALSLASEGAFDQMLAVDLSAPALAQAEQNRVALGARVRLLRGDLCAPLRSDSLDAVVSNPPYLTEAEYASLDPSVKRWEPASALVSGPDGLRATVRLLQETRSVLRVGGWLALEVDCTRAAAVAGQAAALGWVDVAIHADLFGRERYLLARRSAQP
ncbi:MAG: peptide chain release factor N(5)-glutamine methyltransferase [Gemmatimonadales bacterium]|nr:peptide chain release factor N(5)-glutamine methyltransferase [Gemmatimonadales bacterium]